MDDQDFKLKVVADIAEIKAHMEHIKNALPKENLQSKVRLNRNLIYMLYTFCLGVVGYTIKK